MLYEIKKVKQIPGQDFRRWFTDDYFDLFLWYDAKGRLRGFQLSYDKAHRERAVTWTQDGGIRHTGVNDGEDNPVFSMTPLLETDGTFDNRTVAEQFWDARGGLEEKTARFIYRKLADFPPDRNR